MAKKPKPKKRSKLTSPGSLTRRTARGEVSKREIKKIRKWGGTN